jgi:hypothetical protein
VPAGQPEDDRGRYAGAADADQDRQEAVPLAWCGAVVALRDLLPQGVSGTAATASATPRSPARRRPGAVSVAVFSRTFDPVEAERQDRAMRTLIGNDLCHD